MEGFETWSISIYLRRFMTIIKILHSQADYTNNESSTEVDKVMRSTSSFVQGQSSRDDLYSISFSQQEFVITFPNALGIIF